MGLVRRSVLRFSLPSLLYVGTKCTMPPGKTLRLLLVATFVQELLPRAPDEAWPTAIRLLSHTQARTSESTNLDARDTDKNQQIWHAKLVLATKRLHLAQFRQPHRPLAKAVDYADLFIYDEAQQEAALSDLAILGALPHKCLVLRLGDPKQTSGGTGSSDLARRVRLVSDQLALGIRAPRKPCLPQVIPALIQSLLQDDLLQACCSAFRNVAMAEHDRGADVDGPHLVVENHPWMLFCLLSLRACYWYLHYSRSRETCLFGGTLPVTLMPVLVNERRTIGASCYQYPKEYSLVFTPSWLSAGIGMPLSGG